MIFLPCFLTASFKILHIFFNKIQLIPPFYFLKHEKKDANASQQNFYKFNLLYKLIITIFFILINRKNLKLIKFLNQSLGCNL